jgi:hypothetical protein
VTPVDEHGAALSARRAFVVHLAASGGARRRRYRGRVEHLPTGASTHFSSLAGLLAFFAAVLDAGAGRVDSSACRPPDRPARPRRRPSPTRTRGERS